MHDIQKRLLLAITTAYSRSTGRVLVDLHALVKIGPSTGHLCEALDPGSLGCCVCGQLVGGAPPCHCQAKRNATPCVRNVLLPISAVLPLSSVG